jgi:hypothetical protein
MHESEETSNSSIFRLKTRRLKYDNGVPPFRHAASLLLWQTSESLQLSYPLIHNIACPLSALEGLYNGALRNQVVAVKIGAFNVIIRDGLSYTILRHLVIVLRRYLRDMPDAFYIKNGVQRAEAQVVGRVAWA